jgi:chromosome segregation ATPase
MARGKPNPDELIEALEQDRAEITGKQADAGRALAEARAQLADTGATSIRARRYVSELAAAEGRTGELAAVLAKAEADAHAAIRANEPKVEALEGAARNIAAKIETIRDENLEYFARQAHARSIKAVQAQQEARQAIERAWSTWRAADEGWTRVRASRRNRRYPDLPQGPLSDLASLVNAFNRTCALPPWPAGQRPRSDEDLAHAWRDGDYPSSFGKAAPEAIAQFGDAGEPLLESV